MKMSIFGRVEGPAAGIDRVGHAVLFEALLQLLLGALPELVRSEALLRPRRQLGARLEAKRRVLLPHQ